MDFDWVQDLIGEVLRLQRHVQGTLAQEFRDASAGDDAFRPMIALALAIVFGSLHAIGPGHGKSIMMAYFAGQDARMRHGVTASVKLIVTHVGSAILLVLVAVTVIKVSFGFRPADFPVVRQISYAGVAAIGVFLLVQALRARPVHGHGKAGGVLPYVVGLSPCPLTTIIMLAAISTGAVAFGIVVSLAMAAGMIVTVAAFALAAILARRWMLGVLVRHKDRINRIAKAFEIVGAVTVTALGGLLLATEFV